MNTAHVVILFTWQLRESQDAECVKDRRSVWRVSPSKADDVLMEGIVNSAVLYTEKK